MVFPWGSYVAKSPMSSRHALSYLSSLPTCFIWLKVRSWSCGISMWNTCILPDSNARLRNISEWVTNHTWFRNAVPICLSYKLGRPAIILGFRWSSGSSTIITEFSGARVRVLRYPNRISFSPDDRSSISCSFLPVLTLNSSRPSRVGRGPPNSLSGIMSLKISRIAAAISSVAAVSPASLRIIPLIHSFPNASFTPPYFPSVLYIADCFHASSCFSTSTVTLVNRSFGYLLSAGLNSMIPNLRGSNVPNTKLRR